MPFALSQKENSSLLEIEARGKLTHADYLELIPELERMVARHGRIRLLFHMVDFHGWEPAAFWDDARLAISHAADISRIAMVGDKTWERAMSVIFRPFAKAEMRYFDRSDLSLAREWLETPHVEHFAGTTMHGTNNR
jgi:hypothetical protein